MFAKISRAEVARRFMQPAPKEMLDALVQGGLVTAHEAELAQHVAVAEDFTVEADSGTVPTTRRLCASCRSSSACAMR